MESEKTPDRDPFGWVKNTLHDKYRIESIVGDGGFGVVYRAEHTGFAGPVAVKCLKVPAGLTSEQRDILVETLLAEGRLLHTLSRATADVVQALDIGDAISPSGAWTPYLVLEWLEGTTLAADLEERALAAARERKACAAGARTLGKSTISAGRPLADAVALLTPAARALAVAHQLGITHRDIKPSNMFLADIVGHRTMKLLDFGLAKALGTTASAARITRDAWEKVNGVLAFTPRYAAPEQYSYRYGETGPWTDVYSLALVLVEVVTGKPALGAARTEQLYLATSDIVNRPTLRARGVDVPDEVEMVMLRALAVDPRRRYPNAAEFWNALTQATLAMGTAKNKWNLLRRWAPRKTGETMLPPVVPSILSQSIASEGGGPPSITGISPAVTGSWPPPPSEAARWTPGSSLAPTAIEVESGEDLEEEVDERAVWLRRGSSAAALLASAAACASLWIPGALDAPASNVSAAARGASTEVSKALRETPEGMQLVRPAMFIMGSSNEDASASIRPEHAVSLSKGYFIDRAEVTAAEFNACVLAGACTHARVRTTDAARDGVASAECNTVDPARGSLPANCVTFDQAAAYCRFVEKRLPTEAEWEHATRDLSELGFADLLSAGPGVSEWVADGWESYREGELTDPLISASAAKGILRGGSWDATLSANRSTRRSPLERAFSHAKTGFRCAKSVDPT
jgi:serine/threonine protein kinase